MPHTLSLFTVREAVKVEKKVWNFPYFALTPHPPPKVWKNLGGGSKKWKNFFAFLDELGHSEYFLKLEKKKLENGPPLKSWKIPTFFFSTLTASLSQLNYQIHYSSLQSVFVYYLYYTLYPSLHITYKKQFDAIRNHVRLIRDLYYRGKRFTL